MHFKDKGKKITELIQARIIIGWISWCVRTCVLNSDLSDTTVLAWSQPQQEYLNQKTGNTMQTF